jgi:urease accessory protein
MRIRKSHWIAPLIVLVAPTFAFAHPGHGGNGFAPGLTHPFTGLDHLLAMLAVGLWAVQLDRRARWPIPLTFIAMMIAGGILARFQFGLPLVQSGILASILIIGLMLLFALKLPLTVGAALAGAFALFHGYAHAIEMPAGAGAITYTIGFVTATTLLICVGMVVGQVFSALNRPRWIRACGGALCIAAMLLV